MLFTWLAAAGCMVVTYKLGEAIYSRRAALIGVILMMSSFLFLVCAQIVRMDMPMAFFITLAMYVFFIGYQQQRAYAWYLFYIAAALAVLLKGPFGFAIPFIACLCFLGRAKTVAPDAEICFSSRIPCFCASGGKLAAGGMVPGRP